MLNKNHHLAIELKYEGLSYEDIAKELKGKFSVNTLKMYFASDGVLYDAYLDYESKQNQARRDSVQGIFDKHVVTAAQVLVDAMLNAKKSSRKKQEAIGYAEKILDRAGIVVSRKVQIKDDREEKLSDEEFNRELKRQGIDPATGLALRTAKKK